MTRQRTNAESRVRRFTSHIALVVPGAAIVLLAACGRAVPASGDVEAGSAQADAIEVVAVDNDFDPVALEVEAGEKVTVEVRNDGTAPHNFVVKDLDLSTGTIQPGQVVTATFVAPERPVRFVCTFHPGMDGEVHVAAG